MKRVEAIASLLLLVLAVAAGVAIAVTAFPRGLWVAACVAIALPLAWYGALHRGVARWASLVLAALLLVAALALMIVVGPFLGELAVLLLLALAFAAARAAFTAEVELPAAPRPHRAVLFWNPKSGGGKATNFHLLRIAPQHPGASPSASLPESPASPRARYCSRGRRDARDAVRCHGSDRRTAGARRYRRLDLRFHGSFTGAGDTGAGPVLRQRRSNQTSASSARSARSRFDCSGSGFRWRSSPGRCPRRRASLL